MRVKKQMTQTQTQVGSYIAAAGIVVGILSHFGIVLSAQQLGTTINDAITFIGDLAVIYGVIHQYFATKVVSTAAGIK